MGDAAVEPRRRAAQWVADVPGYLWDGRTLPVPVEKIADSHCGLRIREMAPAEMPRVLAGNGPRESEGLSGLLLVSESEIWVNRDEAAQWPGRKRFAVGHELGHWVLHRPTGNVFCRSASLFGVPAGTPEPEAGADIEEEASLFAAELLFPDPLVREHYARLGGDITALCELFGGSRRATERAVIESIRRPRAAQADGVRMFVYDDAGYEAWRAAHHGEGYVLNDTFDDRSRLHHARCSYLDRPATDGVPRTRFPKWCSLDRAALLEVVPATPCRRCRP